VTWWRGLQETDNSPGDDPFKAPVGRVPSALGRSPGAANLVVKVDRRHDRAQRRGIAARPAADIRPFEPTSRGVGLLLAGRAAASRSAPLGLAIEVGTQEREAAWLG